MIVTSTKLFLDAQKHNYAIPATNFIDLDMARIFVQTAEELKKPLILPFAQAHQEVLPLEEAALIGKYFAKKSSVPIVLHLDHGEDLSFIEKAIELGFSSVMIDASKESLEENVRRTKEVVECAHKKGIVVEAEIGHVGSGTNYESHEETDSIYTEVEDAVSFVKDTQVDSLAVSIGTAHGFYKGEPHINFERLNELTESIDIPLVLHGGSSTGDENLARCARSGICKINIFTDFLTAAIKAMQNENVRDYLTLKEQSNQSMKEVLRHYFNVFGTRSKEGIG